MDRVGTDVEVGVLVGRGFCDPALLDGGADVCGLVGGGAVGAGLDAADGVSAGVDVEVAAVTAEGVWVDVGLDEGPDVGVDGLGGAGVLVAAVGCTVEVGDGADEVGDGSGLLVGFRVGVAVRLATTVTTSATGALARSDVIAPGLAPIAGSVNPTRLAALNVSSAASRQMRLGEDEVDRGIRTCT